MPQPVHTLRTVFFALAVTVSLGFGVAQASASPAAPPPPRRRVRRRHVRLFVRRLGQVPWPTLRLLLSPTAGRRMERLGAPMRHPG